jgi:hypothetical protein
MFSPAYLQEQIVQMYWCHCTGGNMSFLYPVLSKKDSSLYFVCEEFGHVFTNPHDSNSMSMDIEIQLEKTHFSLDYWAFPEIESILLLTKEEISDLILEIEIADSWEKMIPHGFPHSGEWPLKEIFFDRTVGKYFNETGIRILKHPAMKEHYFVHPILEKNSKNTVETESNP